MDASIIAAATQAGSAKNAPHGRRPQRTVSLCQRGLETVGSDTFILPEILISEQAVAGGPTS
jgi:hypothetical protein